MRDHGAIAWSGLDLGRFLIWSNPMRNQDLARYPWALRGGHFVPSLDDAERRDFVRLALKTVTAGNELSRVQLVLPV